MMSRLSSRCGHFIITQNCLHCEKIKKTWYKKIKKGFKDIEQENGLLKKWTGISTDFLFNSIETDECISDMQTSWPETNFKKEEEFLNNPDFENICKSLFKHKNNAISAKTMVMIWKSHCDGASLREIEKQFNIHNATVFRAIRRLEEFMKITDLDPQDKIIIRPYSDKTDAPLLYSTWISAIWYDEHGLKDADHSSQIDPAFRRVKSKEIKKLIELPETKIKMACLEFDPDQIVGWTALINTMVEFVYVKINYRKQGIASLLTKGFTHVAYPLTKIGASIVKNNKLKIKENEEDGYTKRKRTQTQKSI